EYKKSPPAACNEEIVEMLIPYHLRLQFGWATVRAPLGLTNHGNINKNVIVSLYSPRRTPLPGGSLD
ncbi:unnamed protein product, partial [Ceratitis capitata]